MKARIFSNIFFRQTSKGAAATRMTVCVIPQTVSSSILVLVLYMYLSALGQNGRARLAIKTKGLVKRLGLRRRRTVGCCYLPGSSRRYVLAQQLLLLQNLSRSRHSGLPDSNQGYLTCICGIFPAFLAIKWFGSSKSPVTSVAKRDA